MDLDTLRQPAMSVAAWLEGVVAHGAPSVQAICDHAHPPAGGVQLVFEHAWPTLIKRQPLASIRNDAPGQRIRVDENLLHRHCGTVYRTRGLCGAGAPSTSSGAGSRPPLLTLNLNLTLDAAPLPNISTSPL